MILIVVPVLNRPSRVGPLMDSIAAATSTHYRLLFVATDGDENEISEIERFGGERRVVPREREGWAKKINLAFSETTEPYLLLGADDLRFHPGWDDEALKVAERTGAGVVGTNDLGNPYVKRGALATHALVARWYVEQHGTIDEPGKVLHEGYWHNWVDAELTETAMSRGLFAFAPRSRVEHMHPNWGKAPMDDTYRIGLDRAHFEEDRRLLNQRRRLWKNDRVSGARRAVRRVR